MQVGIRDSAGEVSWTPLAACVLQGDTLVKARTEAAPAPARPRPEPSETAAPADPLEQALGGLRHALAQHDEANVRTMAQQVQMRLRQTRTRGLAPHLSEEARILLEQASAALPVRQTRTAPRRTPVVPARRREDRRRTAFAHEHIRQAVDKHIGKLLWAQERRLSRAYNDNRAALVRLLNRPDAPKDVVDRIKHQLRVSPKGQFDPPATAPPTQKPRPAPVASEGRGRTREAAQRKERRIRAKTDELLDTLRWAYKGQMPQTYDDTRTRLLGVLGGTGTPEAVKDTIREQLSFYPEGLHTPQVPAPAPPPKKPQASKRQRRGGKPRSRRRTPAPADGADTGLLANARIDARSRHLLERLRAAPQPSTPEETPPERT
ncbi:hypothetical protein BJF83_23180 [Nocardiopsis sp. CNR-923]|uniref:hypothetical protein n=1 Tax=Nocardiopsis sp. CNR-923 TaxID=1904965 RepID=UPI00095E5751|nr:hypothetical protein [Nocardiopsis sp. CNR-923]OLT25309.1 hypothetical protein BJF83_23180 [Nocardiopsis sp. CNR-923]